MAQAQHAVQEEGGWPLGLQPLNNASVGSISSFRTAPLLTASPASSRSSSDLDTESTGSFFHDRSITLGRLMGIHSILEMSKTSVRGGNTYTTENNILLTLRHSREKHKTRFLSFFSSCSKYKSIWVAENSCNAVTLGHQLRTERTAAAGRTHDATRTAMYGPNEIESHPQSEMNSLFIDGLVAPPTCIGEWQIGDSRRVEAANRCGATASSVSRLVLPCMCGTRHHPLS